MRTHRTGALAILLAVVVAACGGSAGDTTTSQPTTTTTAEATTTAPPETTTTQPSSWTFTGPDGVTTEIEDVSRIVSLNGDITEIIFELGLGDNVVAVDVTTTYPEAGAALNESGSTVGFHQQLTPEAVLRFQPTLVIGDTQVGPDETIEQLRQAGIPVAIIETQVTLDGVETKINDVATILGVPEDGEALAARVMADIAAAQARVADNDDDPNVVFLYTRGPQLLLIFGRGMPTQAMIEGAGAVDAGVTTGIMGAAPLTPEALIAAAPDVIVVPESGFEALGGISALLGIPGVSDTPAGENEAVLVYDEAFFFNLGPRVGQALDQFIDDLYPDLAG